MRISDWSSDVCSSDLSYVVHVLDQVALARVSFPVGHLTKAAVREEAARLGLATADKPDSQDVCFITATGGRSSSEERRVGQECVSPCRSRGSPDHEKKKKRTQIKYKIESQ